MQKGLAKTTFEKVRGIICTQLGADEAVVTAETEIVGELGADSLDIREILLDIESEGSVIPDDRLSDIRTIGALADAMDEFALR